MTRFLSHSLLVILSFIFLLPFGWIASLAFKRQIDILMTNIISPISYGNFIKLFASKESTFSNDILNSLFVGLSSTLIVLIVCSLASFTLTRLKIGKWVGMIIFGWVLVFHMIPPITFIGSWFVLANSLGLFNSYSALIIAHATINLPLGLFIITNYMKEIPHEIQEAAVIDGASSYQTYLKIFLPLLIPGLFTAGIIIFLFSWNDFMVSINLSAKATQTVPVSVATYAQQYEVRYGEMAAGSLVSLVPGLLLTIFANRYIVRGITAGSVK